LRGSKNIWWSKNILRGGKRALGGQKYTNYDKINNNSENFRGARLLPGGASPPGPLSCGPGRMDENFVELGERFP